MPPSEAAAGQAIPILDLYAQYSTIKTEIDTAMENVVRASAFAGGPFVDTFEKEFAAYCGVNHGVGVSSGTAAIELVLKALGVGPDDEVITVPNTFIATVESIVHVGATPVFVDVQEDTLNLDPDQLESAITPRTKAIIPVHLYGHLADMDPICDIAKRRDLLIVEDAAQAHGADYHDRRAGAFGVAATFSFYPGKILGAFGDAGIVLTHDEDLATRMRSMANHGRTGHYEHKLLGYNFRMGGLQAAVLSVKLRHLDEWIKKRREQSQLYARLLSSSSIRTPVEMEGCSHVHTYYVIRSVQRDRFIRALDEAQIGSGIHYPIPVHLQPAFADLGYAPGDFPVAEKAAGEILSLPIYAELADEQIERVVNVLNSAE